VPVGIASAVPRDTPTPEAAEFVATVMSLPEDGKRLLAAMLRLRPIDRQSIELADLIDRIADQGGWVRGEQHSALLRTVSL